MPSNPVIKTIFTADPEAKVWPQDPGTLYLYPSRDRHPAAGCDHMDQYHVFSTVNMVDFVDEGEILRRADLGWTEATEIHPQTGAELSFMWAPDVAYRDGYYYFYFPTPRFARHHLEGAPADYPFWNNTWETGVVRSRHPDKDFGPIPEAAAYPGFPGYIQGIGYAGIDAAVRIFDGQAYIYLGGGGHFYQGKLKANMVEMDGPLTKMTENIDGQPPGGISHALPDYHEGPSVFARANDYGELLYYLIYPGYEAGTSAGDSFRYAIGSMPLGNPLVAPVTETTVQGPQTRAYAWNYRGAFFAPTGCETSHGSVVCFRDKWYFVYHTQDFSGHGTQRSVCIEEMHFMPDGSIIPFKKSTDGPAQNGPDYERPQGRIYAASGDGRNGDYVWEQIDGGAGARARLFFNYATADKLPKLELLVNGLSYSYINFPHSGGAADYCEAAFTVKALKPGPVNEIILRRGHADPEGRVDVRYVEVVLIDD